VPPSSSAQLVSERLFIPWALAGAVLVGALEIAFGSVVFATSVAVLATLVTAWAAWSTEAHFSRMRLLDVRDRVGMLSAVGLEILNHVVDPDDVMPREELIKLYPRFERALGAAQPVVNLPAARELHDELLRYYAHWPWERLDIRNKTLTALAEMGQLESALVKRISPPFP
jgi:hypothetical protein